jgi:CRISPR-associated protein Csm4
MDGIIRVYLRPKSPFPDTVPSDTLFGAICCGFEELYEKDKVDALLNSKKPPFLISSAFPFVENGGEQEHFFPKLVVEPAEIDVNLFDKAKKYKKVVFIHERIFNEWIRGEVSELGLIEGIGDSYSVVKGLLVPKGFDIKFDIKTVDLAQNILNRLTAQSKDFFYLTKTYFLNSGLFFMIRFYEDCKDEILAALRFLEDRGIGGDVSTGKGWFEFFYGENKINEPEDGDSFVTLSRYCPTKDEIEMFRRERMYYELIRTRGRSRDGVIKRPLFMFKEGSTFPELGKAFYGKIEKVRENPDVIEFGYSFPIKVRMHDD